MLQPRGSRISLRNRASAISRLWRSSCGVRELAPAVCRSGLPGRAPRTRYIRDRSILQLFAADWCCGSRLSRLRVRGAGTETGERFRLVAVRSQGIRHVRYLEHFAHQSHWIENFQAAAAARHSDVRLAPKRQSPSYPDVSTSARLTRTSQGALSASLRSSALNESPSAPHREAPAQIENRDAPGFSRGNLQAHLALFYASPASPERWARHAKAFSPTNRPPRIRTLQPTPGLLASRIFTFVPQLTSKSFSAATRREIPRSSLAASQSHISARISSVMGSST